MPAPCKANPGRLFSAIGFSFADLSLGACQIQLARAGVATDKGATVGLAVTVRPAWWRRHGCALPAFKKGPYLPPCQRSFFEGGLQRSAESWHGEKLMPHGR